MINWLGPFVGLLFVILIFSIKGDVRGYFLTFSNFRIILTQTVIVAIGALGMTMIIVSGGIDLSVGSLVALCSVLGALLTRAGWPVGVVVPVTVLAGGLVGLVNGTVISYLRINAFIVTLGMLGVARGAAKWLAGNQTVNYSASPLNDLMAPGGFLPNGVWVAAVLALLTALVMQRTVFGRHVFAIGSNEATARLCGLRVEPLKVAIYAAAGLFFGLAGLMQLARLRQGDPTVAIGLELDVIAAVVIGGGSLHGGSGSVLGAMIGALIMAVLRNGSQQMGWPTYVQEIIIGVVIVVAVGLDQVRRRRVEG
jgi:ribose transport system permease protein